MQAFENIAGSVSRGLQAELHYEEARITHERLQEVDGPCPGGLDECTIQEINCQVCRVSHCARSSLGLVLGLPHPVYTAKDQVFFAWRRRDACMAKLVNRMKEYAREGPLLFGDGANSGLFGRVRGGGVKSPALEIKKRLSKQMPVIECSEFRTSKLCLDCGRAPKFYQYGVTYCSQRGHNCMANRVVVAAKKGARYIATKRWNLGSWCRSVSADAVQRGTHASTVLKDVLPSYESGTYF